MPLKAAREHDRSSICAGGLERSIDDKLGDIYMAKLAIIGSSGLSAEDFLTGVQPVSVATDAGTVSLEVGHTDKWAAAFLRRSHGRPGLPPHAVNYRANILALKQLGVEYIFATSVVGSLSTTIPAGTLVVLDQFLDFTKQREITIFDEVGFAFVDMTDPYCPQLRSTLIRAAQNLREPVRPTGCYVGVEGPRYETRAEIEMYRRLGGDVIGMTNVPEAVMARESGLCYAATAFVSNLGAGLNDRRISQIDNRDATLGAIPALQRILGRALDGFEPDDTCACRSAVDLFFTAEAASSVSR